MHYQLTSIEQTENMTVFPTSMELANVAPDTIDH
jgi:hypothetical protein